MLEDLAFRYSELDDLPLALLLFGSFFLGGILGVITNRSVAEIQRAPYFALFALIYLLSSLVAFVGVFFVVEAIVHGYSWTLVGLELATPLVSGFFIARLSGARSRDAHGHGSFAVLGVIPLANLWLIFKPSRNDASPNRMTFVPALSGRTGACAGFLFFFASALFSSMAETETMHRIEAASLAGVFDAAFLDENLQSIAAHISVPHELDETTTLVRVEAHGAELRYIYDISLPIDRLPEEFRLALIEKNCSPDHFASEIAAGAIIKHVYLRRDGTEIDEVEVSEAAC